jgi:anti-sigma regulatory factor (Ser/Thr protein kinase)
VIVDDTTKVGEARRRAVGLAEQLGFDKTKQGQIALIATEAATNLHKHAGGGELIIQGLDYGESGAGLEVLAVDRGRGMTDVRRCLADGYSTAGSPGNGLSAIERLSNAFDIYSIAGAGTILWARLDRMSKPPADHDRRLAVGVVRIPAPHEEVCGDGWATIEGDGFSLFLVVDGLGHGPSAAEAADLAVRIFRGQKTQDPDRILESIHGALRSTRGAAAAIALLDRSSGEVRYAGIGNISGLIFDRRTSAMTSMVSQNGTVGYAIRKIQVYQYPWTEESLLLMHSDGLATHWNLDRYPGLWQRHPSLAAGVLYRDHNRGRDDVTVLVAGYQKGAQS